MSEFEVLRSLAFGQYLPTDSVLHRLDPRVKLTGAVLLTLVLMVRGGTSVALLGLALALTLLGLARVPLGHALRGLRPLLPLFLIVLLLQLLFYPHSAAVQAGSLVVWQWGPVLISGASLVALVAMLLRMVAIVLLLTLLTAIADTSDLTHGVEGVLRPFQGLGLPAHELSLVLVVTLRFVPLLGQELERLMKAQAARGADFGRGRGGFVPRVRRTFPLIVPLFVAALRRSEELAVAMEARGYGGGKGRSHFVRLHLRPADWLALGLVIGITVGLFVADLGPLERAAALWLRGLLVRS
jgi:energy-coupling factor transport system permease protein